MKERPLLYLALFLGIGSLIFIGSNNIEIRNYFENFQYEPLVESLNAQLDNSSTLKQGIISGNSVTHQTAIAIQPSCEYLLGILTISSHSSLRNFIRKSWINDLPKNVCYKFLYDKRKDIPDNEKFDGVALKAKYKGWAVRFGEKLYKYFKYVINTPKYKDVKYVVKMDDDAVLCPKKFLNYLSDKKLTTKSYAGWFHNMGSWKSKVDFDHRSDEMFVLLGRDLVNRIASKSYCKSKKRKECDSLNQLYDTNYGGTSLGIWLSEMNDINPLPMNDVFDHMNSNKKLKPKDAILFHTAKTPEIAKEKYSNCRKKSKKSKHPY